MTILTKEEWLKRKRKRAKLRLGAAITLLVIILCVVIYLIIKSLVMNFILQVPEGETIAKTLSNGSVIQTDYLTPNPYSRPQTRLKRVRGIVIHYTANPGTSAENNRSYFNGLAKKHTTYASSHYIVGLEGEIIQCIPLTEIAYASNDRNKDTISIECCHPDETGKFNDLTYDTLVSLTAALCIEFHLEERDILRHYDVNGKLCPLYYVEQESAWERFKEDVIIEVELLKKQEKAASVE